MQPAKSDFTNIYSVIKAAHPIHTTVKDGVNMQKLVIEQHEGLYRYFLLKRLDWSDIDGVLDYLYGLRDWLNIPEADTLIKFIESHCEIER